MNNHYFNLLIPSSWSTISSLQSTVPGQRSTVYGPRSPKTKIEFKKLIVILIVVIATAIYSAPAYSANDKTGTTSAAFMKLFGGVKQASLGGAFIAIADDVSTVSINPAGISQFKSFEFGSTFMNYFSGISYTNVSSIIPMKRTTIGFSLDYLNEGVIEETTLANPAGTGKTINPYAYSGTLAISQKLLPFLSVGVGARVIGEKLSTRIKSGYGADIGIHWAWNHNFSVGLNGRNIAGSFEGKAIPGSYGLGIAYKFNQFLFALDGNMLNDNQVLINLGAEYNINNILFARFGFNTKSEENAGGNLGAGIGLRAGRIKIDYAYIPYGDLGITHRFSVGLNLFGEANRLSDIIVYPSRIAVKVGQKIKFSAYGFDERGNETDVSPIWKAEGDNGEINPKTGVFIGKIPGSGKVIAYQEFPIDKLGNMQKIYEVALTTVYIPKKVPEPPARKPYVRRKIKR